MYRIAVLTDLKHEAEHYAKVINDYCINQKLFPLLETYQNQEVFFKEIQTHVPDMRDDEIQEGLRAWFRLKKTII